MTNNLFIQKKPIIFLIFSFLSARLIMCSLIFIFLPLYDPRFFTFKDLEFYKDVPSGIFTPNFLYAYLIKFIGYNTNNIHSFNSLIISFIISIIIFLPWIFLSKKILPYKTSLIYSILLGLHPYLALYSFKFDTTSFAVLPVAFYVIERLINFSKLKLIGLITSTLSSFFRSQILLLAWLQMLSYLSIRKKFFLKKTNIIILLILLLLVFCSVIQFNYGADILTQNFGCYTLPNIKNYFEAKAFNETFSTFFSVLITPFIHFLLLLGAREAISIYCIDLPKEFAQNGHLNIIHSISFLIFHLFSFYRMLKFVFSQLEKKRLDLLVPFILILPNLYGMAHLRYFICFIPYVMLFLFNHKSLKVSNPD